MTPDPTLQIETLTLAYGRREVVTNLSLAVRPGSVYALLGRNGAGKSTLVRALLGLERPRAGQARIFGLDPWPDRARIMARLGVVPEHPEVPPRMSSAQASAFCASLAPQWDGAGVNARLTRLGIPPQRPFGELSRGQQTQVALALALGGRPDLLILDDPTLGLDPVARHDLYRELLEDLGARGTTVFLTTHDLAGIEGLADRVGILDQGRLVLDEELEALKGRCRRLHCPPARTEAGLAGLGPRALNRTAFGLEATLTQFSQEAAAAAGLEPAWVTGASLEDIFLALATEEVQP